MNQRRVGMRVENEDLRNIWWFSSKINNNTARSNISWPIYDFGSACSLMEE